MDAIVNTAPSEVCWEELPLPVPGPGEVRIRTLACGVCATDLEMIAGWERTACPAIPGHEWAGGVDAVGEGVDEELLGNVCVGENVRADGGEVGFEHPGGYAQFFVTDAACLRRLPDEFPADVATLIEPLAVAVRGLRRLRLDVPQPTLIFGDGPLGLLFVMLLRRAGVERIALVGGRTGRLSLAKELGATVTVNYHEVDGPGALCTAAGGWRWPCVIEASGSAGALDGSLDLASSQGRILCIGDYASARATFPWNDLLHRELELIGSNASAGAWDEAVRLATTTDLPLAKLITHRVPARKFADALALMRNRDSGAIKVVLAWPEG